MEAPGTSSGLFVTPTVRKGASQRQACGSPGDLRLHFSQEWVVGLGSGY